MPGPRLSDDGGEGGGMRIVDAPVTEGASADPGRRLQLLPPWNPGVRGLRLRPVWLSNWPRAIYP